MVSMGISLFINEGQFSNRDALSAFPSIGPIQLTSLTPTISGVTAGNDRADSAPCLKAVEIGLDGQTISGILYAPRFNVAQRSFHRWCATDEVQYPIIFGPAVYYKFKGNGLTTTLRFCGDSRYRLNLYDSCTTGPRAYYDESCVGSVSTFSPDCATIALDASNDIDYFILISTGESRDSDYGAYEIALSSNDSCERSSEIQIDGSMLSVVAPATEGSLQGCESANQAGAWYSVLGTGESFTINTCQSTSPGTQLTVYTAGCAESQQCVGTSEIGYACAEQGSVSWVSDPNERYYIHAYGSSGMFNLSASRSMPNDLCEGALSISTQITQTYSGNTSGATSASDAAILWSSIFPCSDYSGSPSVWYSMQGANFIYVDTCDDEDKGFEPQITLLQGSCDSLACTEVSVSKPCRSGSGAQVLWTLMPGETYYLFIHGKEENETGSFQLTVTTFGG